MRTNNQLMKIKPNVALLDDDSEFANDLIACLDNDFDVTHFTNINLLHELAKMQYYHFIRYLGQLFSVIGSEHATPSDAESVFTKIVAHRPYSVALIDLDLGNNDADEGFKIGDSISQFYLKPLIYTASESSSIMMDMINQGDIYGYLNKLSDLYEDLLPTIHHINDQFYQFHFNISHLSYLCGALDFGSDLEINPDIEEYTVYNANLNIVTV